MTINEMQTTMPHYLEILRKDEKAPKTIEKYKRDIEKFFDWGIQEEIKTNLEKDHLLQYKKYLTDSYKPTSVNSFLIALNKYLEWVGLKSLQTNTIKLQQRNSLENVLSRSDYERLIRRAKILGKEKIYLIMRTLASTGIRIEELKFITVEVLTQGKGCVQVDNKGKLRDIVLTQDLCKELKKYCRENEITTGIVFCSKNGSQLLDKAYIWREMKYIAGQARVNKKKVHAHSFRHLFARVFMDTCDGNIVELADLLGHSSLETTRIYTRSSNKEKREKITKMGL